MAIVCSVKNAGDRIAVTFDDGPYIPYTEQILEVLALHRAKATFFVLGSALTPATCEVVKQAHAAGHEIGNHTQNHYGLSQASLETIEAEIVETHDRLSELLLAPPRLIRPPYGRGSEAVDRCASNLGYQATVLWNICPSDWEMPPAATITSRVLAGESPFHDEIGKHCGHTPKASLRGAIVLLHDGCGPKRQGESRSHTVEAVRTIVPELLSRGFQLVTVSEMLAASGA